MFGAFLLALVSAQLSGGCPADWKKISEFPSHYVINDMEFQTRQIGWAAGFTGKEGLGNAGVILGTEDGGYTWQEQYVGTRHSCFNTVYISRENDIWAAGRNVRCRSCDGRTWHTVPDSLFNMEEFYGLDEMCSIDFYDADFGMLGGIAGHFAITRNGGSTWETGSVQKSSIGVDTLQSISILSPDVIIIAVSGGIVRSQDSGKTWEQVYSGVKNYHRLCVIDDSTAYAMCREREVLFTEDRGISWSVCGTIKSEYAYAADMAFYNTETGWACTESGRVWKTTDGADSWKPSVIHNNTALTNLCVLCDEQYGYTCTACNELYGKELGVISVCRHGKQHAETCLLQLCYPSSFNPCTRITYYVPKPSYIQIDIYNNFGQIVGSPVSAYRETGTYQVPFSGSGLPAGMYVCKMKGEDHTVLAEKLLLVR